MEWGLFTCGHPVLLFGALGASQRADVLHLRSPPSRLPFEEQGVSGWMEREPLVGALPLIGEGHSVASRPCGARPRTVGEQGWPCGQVARRHRHCSHTQWGLECQLKDNPGWVPGWYFLASSSWGAMPFMVSMLRSTLAMPVLLLA